ncbi:unnamed protein product [Paramecium sonneborni]|uniref:Uncharacterized protein n=1 Tax=Paramecium sonneborni TaxID=65129 RepID=A0A8S1QFK2_9CILI|nr:unnamed protein product [Paramecium sonneborni]
MEKIQNLYWLGQYDQKKKKDGKWMASWNGKDLIQVGGYYKKGLKQGLWNDLFEDHFTQPLIFYTGEYLNDFRIGKWKYFNKNKIIGGGFYDNEGKKIGKWTEFDKASYYISYIIYTSSNGEYNKKGVKVGKWDILFNNYGNQQIGGGQYDLEGSEKKVGKWIDLDKEFRRYKQVTYNGEYNLNGMKVGIWRIFFSKGDEYKQIGCGSYDIEGSQKKMGQWIELDEAFNIYKQVTYNGEYNMNGMKVGRWCILFKWEDEYEEMQILNKNQQSHFSGGGSYDQEGSQRKIGQWIDLDEGFFKNSLNSKQITYNGEYNMNGVKVGRWNIMQCKRGQQEYKQMQILSKQKEFKIIGGGSYDQEGSQKKVGKWVELDDNFSGFQQVTFNGQYNMKGIKVGGWDIMFCEWDKDVCKRIGGGAYDQEGGQKKIGKWVEMDEDFLVAYNGEYNINGLKIGVWVEMDLEKLKKYGEEKYENLKI